MSQPPPPPPPGGTPAGGSPPPSSPPGGHSPPPPGGAQAGRPQAGGPQSGGPQAGGPQAGGPQAGGQIVEGPPSTQRRMPSMTPEEQALVRDAPTHLPRFSRRFTTQAEEDAFDVVRARQLPKPLGVSGSIAHLVKGALGAGILGAHVAVKKIGPGLYVPLTLLIGVYVTYCLLILVESAQKLYRRTGVPVMTYPDVGEAAMTLFPNPTVKKFAKFLRYSIDIIICIDLFGSCTCYQIIIASTIKQLVENVQVNVNEGLAPYYLHKRIYLALCMLPCVVICLIRHLKWLAPFSMVANALIVLAMCMAVYYCFQENPSFSGLGKVGGFNELFEFVGMTVFAMSCAGVVIPIENNMSEPQKYPKVLFIGMFFVVFGVLFTGFFGYVAYLDKSTAPITLNFPMDTFPLILKGCIAFMVYVTHALNYWVPFNLTFYYLAKLHHPKRIIMMEYIYRAIFCMLITVVAIIFPNISSLMGFIGTFCLSNMAFIWPNLIEMLVVYERPGYGVHRWRLWKEVVLIIIGIFLFSAGTYANVVELVESM